MKIVALMSGSSLDGLDIAYMEIIQENTSINWNLIVAELSPYTAIWKDRLFSLPKESALTYVMTKADYSVLIADTVKKFILSNKLSPDIISWHGHTIYHRPLDFLSEQIGEGGIMASITGVKTVTDFRINDIALGGQGTPIAPIVEEYFFQNYDYCLNLGGIANISIRTENKIAAYDICPANQLLNYLCIPFQKEYDENGNLARKGNCDPGLLSLLGEEEYYSLSFPKSLDNNWIREVYFPILDKCSISNEDKLATVVRFICDMIIKDLIELQKTWFNKDNTKLLVTGGGSHNLYLIELLKLELSVINIELIVPSKNIIDYKETILMGLMGYLRIQEKSNVLSSVTGATKDSIGGAVYLP